MAKSLRSKSKLKSKSIKRKGEFSKFVDDRNKRISDKMAEDLKKQAEAKAEQRAQGQEQAESMEVDKKSKVSTSGWRDSRHQDYKKRKNNKSKKHLKF